MIKAKKIFEGLFVSIVSVMFTLFLLEIGVRWVKGVPLTRITNFVEDHITKLRTVYPAQHDAYLGWVPSPGRYGSDNFWGKDITILEHGIRYNGREFDGRDSLTILAVGNSFTYGDQVANHETWPSQLEELGKIRVINGGVFGYGLDQSIMRAEKLVRIFNPDILIVSFISDDIERIEFSMRAGITKPYFNIHNGELRLRNAPIPRRPDTPNIGLFRKVFGYSLLTDKLMHRLGLTPFWYVGDWRNRHQAHQQGEEVGCLLMTKLAELSRNKKLKVVLLAQYVEPEIFAGQPSNLKTVMTCATQNNLMVLDLYDDFRAIAELEPERIKSLFAGHMTEAGNRFVAEQLFELLVHKHIVRPLLTANQ